MLAVVVDENLLADTEHSISSVVLQLEVDVDDWTRWCLVLVPTNPSYSTPAVGVTNTLCRGLDFAAADIATDKLHSDSVQQPDKQPLLHPGLGQQDVHPVLDTHS